MTTIHEISMSIPVIEAEDDAMEISSEAGRKFIVEDVDIDLQSGDEYDDNGGDDYMIEDANSIVDEDIIGNEGHEATNDDEMLDELQYPHTEEHPVYDEDIADVEEDGDPTTVAEIVDQEDNAFSAANATDQHFPETYATGDSNAFTAIADQSLSAAYKRCDEETHVQQSNDSTSAYQFADGADDIINYEEDLEPSSRLNVDEQAQHPQQNDSAPSDLLEINVVSPYEKNPADDLGFVGEAVSQESNIVVANDEGLDTFAGLADDHAQEVSDLTVLKPSADNIAQPPVESQSFATENQASNIVGDEAVDPLPDHPDPVVSSANNAISPVGLASCTPFGLHSVIVLYQDSEISLFPPDEDGPEPSQTYFLEDPALADHNLLELLMALRTILGDSIVQQDELHVKIAQLGLEFSETSPGSSTVTLKQILDLYLHLEHNDGIAQPAPLNLELTLKEKLAARLEYLRTAATEGKGRTQLHNPQGVTEIYDENDGGPRYEEDNRQLNNDSNYGKVDTEHQYNETGETKPGDSVKYEENSSEQLLPQLSTDAHNHLEDGQEYHESEEDGYDENQGFHYPDEEEDYDEENGKYDDEEEYDHEEDEISRHGEGDYTNPREDFDESHEHDDFLGSMQQFTSDGQDNPAKETETVMPHPEEPDHDEFDLTKDPDYIDYDEDEKAHDLSTVSSTLQGDDHPEGYTSADADDFHGKNASEVVAERKLPKDQNGSDSHLTQKREEHSLTNGPSNNKAKDAKTLENLATDTDNTGEKDQTSTAPNPSEAPSTNRELYEEDEITYDEDEGDTLADDRRSQEYASVSGHDNSALKRLRTDNEGEIDFEEGNQETKRFRSA